MKKAEYENYNCNNIKLSCLIKEKGNTFKLAVIMIEFVKYERYFWVNFLKSYLNSIRQNWKYRRITCIWKFAGLTNDDISSSFKCLQSKAKLPTTELMNKFQHWYLIYVFLVLLLCSIPWLLLCLSEFSYL